MCDVVPDVALTLDSSAMEEQGTLIRILLRLYYIQRIRFIPSAYYLVVSTAVIVIGILLLTELEPFNASVVALGLVAFIFIYLIKLIAVANTPFHAEGATQDDVSLFLVEEALQHLADEELEERRHEDHDEEFYLRLKQRNT